MASPRSADGERVFWRSHRRSWEQVREAAKLPGLRVHDLRHTCATFWLAAGLSVHAAAELLGHVDAALVLRLYGHALPAEVSTAAGRLEAWRAAQRVLAERPFQNAWDDSTAQCGSERIEGVVTSRSPN